MGYRKKAGEVLPDRHYTQCFQGGIKELVSTRHAVALLQCQEASKGVDCCC